MAGGLRHAPRGRRPAPAGYYRVQSGDTLYRIARKHRQSVGNLARWNQLSDSSNIQAGQLLRVQPPSAGKTAGNASRPPAKPAEKPAPPPARLDIKLQWPASGALIAGFDGNRNKGIDIAATPATRCRPPRPARWRMPARASAPTATC